MYIIHVALLSIFVQPVQFFTRTMYMYMYMHSSMLRQAQEVSRMHLRNVSSGMIPSGWINTSSSLLHYRAHTPYNSFVPRLSPSCNYCKIQTSSTFRIILTVCAASWICFGWLVVGTRPIYLSALFHLFFCFLPSIYYPM